MATRPVGAIVPQRTTSQPTHKALTGASINLTPLTATHAAGLEPSFCKPENAWLWDYMAETPPDAATLRSLIASKAASTDPLYFAIEKRDGEVVGYCSLMRNAPGDLCIEVGNILYAPAFQRSRGATEVIFLLLREAFDGLGYRRVEWKCNDLNAPSRRAALRYGFVYEGTFRQHMIVKGRNRDTAWFGMCDGEWEGIKKGFEKWLDEANFDANGVQVRGLVECREEAKAEIDKA